MRFPLILLLGLASIPGVWADGLDVFAQPPPDAHEAMRPLVFDPAYSATEAVPAADLAPGKTAWAYGNGQLEAWTIHRIVQEGFATDKQVTYFSTYGLVAKAHDFRHRWPASGLPLSITLRANGAVHASLEGKVLFDGPAADAAREIPLPDDAAGPYLQVEVKPAQANEPAALLIEDGPFRTDSGWEWSPDGKTWTDASRFPQTRSGIPPHLAQEPTLVLHPTIMADGIYDFGFTILGRPVFRCEGTPTIETGESVPETHVDPAHADSNMDVVQLPDGSWTSKHQLGFRYLRIAGEAPRDVLVQASFHPARYAGAFACSDEQLTRAWVNSAFTLRMCMQDLMIDGVKRDRMPWIGDQALNLIVNAYTFADPEIVRRSFTALGRPTDEYINGIVDYSLWWVVNQDVYQRYFDDPAYLKSELPHIDAILAKLATRADQEGLLRPGPSWVFIDWGVGNDKTKTLTALQVMWYWAQRSGERLAAKAGDAGMAARWKARADALATLLQDKAWSPSQHAWKEYLESPSADSPYPNLLAVLSGLAQPEQYPGIKSQLTRHPCQGTPFMMAFSLMALSEVGGSSALPQAIRTYWGGMLNRGATTFWEDFKIGEKDDYGMYSLPFGKSLCHAWASGPGFLLPGEILGIRPLRDGWKEFAVEPHLGDLAWASASVPTPSGAIEVRATARETTVAIPAGLTLRAGDKTFAGPQTATLPAAP
jgi:alpha-L-rhamnosidase